MAQFSYEQYKSWGNNNNFGDRVKVDYLSKYLKNDGDKVIVRFPYKSIQEFDCADVHTVKTGSGLYRNVVCLRENGRDDIEKCPLCASNNISKKRLFAKLVLYLSNEKGEIVPTPATWEANMKVADKLADLIQEYGDLSNYVFRVIRHGAHGDTKTAYEVIPVNPTMYPETIYKKDFTGLENVKRYQVKNFVEIQQFLETGEFPQVKREDSKQDNLVQTATPQSYEWKAPQYTEDESPFNTLAQQATPEVAVTPDTPRRVSNTFGGNNQQDNTVRNTRPVRQVY